MSRSPARLRPSKPGATSSAVAQKTAIEAIIKAIILIVICSPYLLCTQSYCFPTAFQSNAVNNVPTRLRGTSTSLTHYKKMAGI